MRSTLQRLKDRVDELMAMAQKRSPSVGVSNPAVDKYRLAAQKLTPYYARTSTSFRNQLLAIRRRRRLHEEKGTLSGRRSIRIYHPVLPLNRFDSAPIFIGLSFGCCMGRCESIVVGMLSVTPGSTFERIFYRRAPAGRIARPFPRAVGW